MPNYITASEAARRLGLTRQTILKWCADGELTHLRMRVGSRNRYFVDATDFEKRINDSLVQSKASAKRLPGRPDKLKAVNGGR